MKSYSGSNMTWIWRMQDFKTGACSTIDRRSGEFTFFLVKTIIALITPIYEALIFQYLEGCLRTDEEENHGATQDGQYSSIRES